MHSKRHAVCDGIGRPLRIALTKGQRSEYDGARWRWADPPTAKQVLAEKGDDAAWFRDGFATRTIRACIAARGKGSHPARHAVRLSQQRHTMENMFGRLTDWRRLALRDDHCDHTAVSAMCLAATGIFWLSFTRLDPRACYER